MKATPSPSQFADVIRADVVIFLSLTNETR